MGSGLTTVQRLRFRKLVRQRLRTSRKLVARLHPAGAALIAWTARYSTLICCNRAGECLVFDTR